MIFYSSANLCCVKPGFLYLCFMGKIKKTQKDKIKEIYKTQKPSAVKIFKANSDYLSCLSFVRPSP